MRLPLLLWDLNKGINSSSCSNNSSSSSSKGQDSSSREV
jgi:hypothetical protein